MQQERIVMSVADLQARKEAPRWSIIDCRSDLWDPDAGRRRFEAGHIPGAVFLDLDRDLAGPITAESGRHPLPDAEAICNRLGELGIGNADSIAVYDDGNGSIAARAWWILRWLGHTSVFLLDGGFRHWLSQGLPVETGWQDTAPRQFVGKLNDALVVTTDELAADLDRIPARNLLDARDRARFRGEVEPIDPVAGHVPGARSVPFAEFLNADDTWRPLQERRELLETVLGTDRDVAWSVMCGSGVTACHLAITGLEAGFRDPQLYVGSWSEWIRDKKRPVGTDDG